jgi:hypothetical protein
LWWHVQWLAIVIPISSKRLTIESLLARFTPAVGRTPYRGLERAAILDRVHRRLRRPWRMRGRRCLRLGLMCFHLLRLAGVPAVIHFGVIPSSLGRDRSRAHCWVTVHDRIVAAPPLEPMLELFRHGQQTDLLGDRPGADAGALTRADWT